VTDLMSNRVQEDASYRNKPQLLSFNSRISVVGPDWIKLDRALKYNVSTQYNPILHKFEGGYLGGRSVSGQHRGVGSSNYAGNDSSWVASM
jgi:hypothetical protein